MSGLIRREPWGLLGQFHDEIDRLFQNRPSLSNELPSVASDWVPAVDVKEESDKYIIHADVPGVDPKDIHVSMENGLLTIRGERKHEKNEAEQGFKRVERVSGTFFRRFSLPDTVNAEGITAKGVHGVLEVVIPKSNQPQARKIEVEG